MLREPSYVRVFTFKFLIIPVGIIMMKPFIHLFTKHAIKVYLQAVIRWSDLFSPFLLAFSYRHIWSQSGQQIVACVLLPSDCKQIHFVFSACFGERYSYWILFL